MSAQIIRKAVKGNEKAMLSLYEANKARVRAVCSVLLYDEKDVKQAVAKVFDEVWIKARNAGTESLLQFSELCTDTAVRVCRSVIFNGDTSIYKIQKPKYTPSAEISKEKSEGNPNETLKKMKSALKSMDKCERFIFISYAVIGLSVPVICSVCHAKESTMEPYIKVCIASALPLLEKDGVNAGTLADALDKYVDSIASPESDDIICKNRIAKNSVHPSPAKKIGFGIAAVVLAALVVAICISLIPDNDDTDTETTAAEETEAVTDETEATDETDETAEGTETETDVTEENAETEADTTAENEETEEGTDTVAESETSEETDAETSAEE